MASSSGLRVFYYNTPPNARIPTPINTTSTTSTSSPNTNPNITDTDITDTDTDRDNDGGDDTPSSSFTRRPQPIPPPLAHLPTFDSRFRSTEPQFYFYHVVDTRDASLRVHVLGPGLSFTFTHERARRHLSAGRIAQGLHRKTTGFLALVRTCGGDTSSGSSGGRDDIGNSNGGSPEHQQQQRTVLVWAESGHGAGRTGDMLDPTPGALPNGRWTRRAVALAALLGLRTERPFDTMGPPEGQLDERARERLRGVFLASHVEVKLATHGVYALLHVFGLYRESSPSPSRRQHQRNSGSSSSSSSSSSGGSNNTIRNVSVNNRPGPETPRSRGAAAGCETSRGLDLATLARLREVRWDDGSRPRLEVYFSRRNCVPCGAFVKRLSEVTGVRIDLIWRERLTHVVYETRAGGGGGGGGGGLVREPNPAASRTAALQGVGGSMGNLEDVLMRDGQNGGGIASAQRQQQPDDVQMLDVVDLTGTASRCCIDLTGEPQTTEAPVCDLTSEGTASGVEKDGCTDDNNAAGRRGIDEDTRAAYMAAYLDGLAYCVGQLPRMTTTMSISPHGHMADATSRQGEASATQGEEAWRAVRMAIVDFAKRMLLLRRADRLYDTGRLGDGKDGTNISDAQDPSNGKTTPHDRRAARAQRRMREVNKPLPATPETRPPAWMMDIDGEEDIWEMDEVASPTVTRREAGACHGPKGANRVEGTRSGGMHGRSRARTLGDALGGDRGTRAGSGGQRRKRAWDGSTRADACRG